MISPIPNYEGFNITFQTTEDCNLQCKYCYEINKRRNDLPLDYAKKFIDMILETDDPLKIRGTKDEWILNQGLILDFIGGDSFMRPKLMDEILSYFQFKAHSIGHRWANRWRASISTNGTLFDNPEVRNLMIKYKGNISVGVSVDGCPQIHDKNRIFPDGSGSMDAILKWWDWYLDYVGIDNATTKATLNKDSIPHIYESIKYLHETMKLKHINMNFIFEEMNLTEDDYQEIEKQFDKSIDYIFEHREDLYVSMFSREFGCATKCEPDKLNTSWCGGGLMPCVTPSGDIFPCFRFTQITMEEGTELLKLGNVFDGWIDADKTTNKIRNSTRANSSPKECLECNYESTCAWCVGGEYARTGELKRGISLCRIKKITAKYSDIYWERYNKSKQKEN